MYSREIEQNILTFEASGALLHASLVMRDRETDSWWSILGDDAIAGELEGTRLRQLPGSEKTTWGDWRARHPGTRVLSVDGVEHRAESPYDRYFASAEGFRGIATADERLAQKADVFTFEWRDRPIAVPHEAFEGGAVLPLGDGERVFLYREADDSRFRSTTAFAFERSDPAPLRRSSDGESTWSLSTANGRDLPWDPESRTFGKAKQRSLQGFDTLWYIWSLHHPETEILESPSEASN